MNFIEKYISNRYYAIKPYAPRKYYNPPNKSDVPSAWKGLETILEDIVDRFKIEPNCCLEFGVEFGFSTVILSNYFKQVIGIDTFEGDMHTTHKGNHYDMGAALSRHPILTVNPDTYEPP